MTLFGVPLGPVVWNGLSGGLPRAALLLAGLFVAQRFGPDDFARYSLALSTFAVLGSLLGSSMTTVASKFIPEFAQGDPERAGTGSVALLALAATLAVAFGGILLGLAPWLATLFELQPPVTGLLRAAALAIVATIVTGGLMGLMVGTARFRDAALANLAGFAAFVVSIVPLCAALGPAGALIALGVLNLAAGAVAGWKARGYVTKDLAAPQIAMRWRSLVGFLVPILIAAGLVAPVVWLCNTLLARGDDALAALARFNAAYTWFAVVSFIPAVLAQVEFVRMSQARARGDAAMLAREFRRFTVRNAMLMLPLTIAGALLASVLVSVFRLEGANAERSLQLMMAAAFMASLGNPAGLFLGVIDRVWIASGLNLAWGIITIVVAWALREHGELGVAGAFLVGYSIHFVVATSVAHRLVNRPIVRRPL